ncbi:hypothetical protein AGLY_009109 [Aphis glycines]|uniref:Uncharacterized protein n=1 Tax=Aphis glycines TaxID=307491 RepID=A0A6G0TIZ0_APHGL|nr:hypothetical protein AGLY_009109 [Aphis glycines]
MAAYYCIQNCRRRDFGYKYHYINNKFKSNLKLRQLKLRGNILESYGVKLVELLLILSLSSFNYINVTIISFTIFISFNMSKLLIIFSSFTVLFYKFPFNFVLTSTTFGWFCHFRISTYKFIKAHVNFRILNLVHNLLTIDSIWRSFLMSGSKNLKKVFPFSAITPKNCLAVSEKQSFLIKLNNNQTSKSVTNIQFIVSSSSTSSLAIPAIFPLTLIIS